MFLYFIFIYFYFHILYFILTIDLILFSVAVAHSYQIWPDGIHYETRNDRRCVANNIYILTCCWISYTSFCEQPFYITTRKHYFYFGLANFAEIRGQLKQLFICSFFGKNGWITSTVQFTVTYPLSGQKAGPITSASR